MRCVVFLGMLFCVHHFLAHKKTLPFFYQTNGRKMSSMEPQHLCDLDDDLGDVGNRQSKWSEFPRPRFKAPRNKYIVIPSCMSCRVGNPWLFEKWRKHP